jgi:DnaJ family protein C protein 17
MENKDLDYYALLEIEITSTSKEIERAYRKKALKVHPDKNPSPDAAALFHTLTQAYETLTDAQKRKDYDQKHRARQERLKKKNEMDSKRRNAQEELERRENEAKKARNDENQAKAEYEAHLARLREEGAKRRQENWNSENIQKEELPEPTELDCALKFKWKRKKYDFSEQDLQQMLSPLASIDTVALSQKKKGSALVVFNTVVDAYGIIMKKDFHPTLTQFENIDWATGKVPNLVERMQRAEEMKKQARAAYFNINDRQTTASGKPLFATSSSHSFFKPSNIPSGKKSSSSIFDYDYESITLMKMRQAERDRSLYLQTLEQAQ